MCALTFNNEDALNLEDDLPNVGKQEHVVLNGAMVAVDPFHEEDNGESSLSPLNADKLLAFMLTCGSQRINATMYGVVRKLLSTKTCNTYNAPITGSSLPGLTYLKTRVKPSVRNLLAKHHIVQLAVDTSRAEAKVGVDKYSQTYQYQS